MLALVPMLGYANTPVLALGSRPWALRMLVRMVAPRAPSPGVGGLRVGARVVTAGTPEETEEVAGCVRICPAICKEIAVLLVRGLAIVVLGAERHTTAATGELASPSTEMRDSSPSPALGDTVLGIQPQTLVVAIQDEVGHTADGIRAIRGRKRRRR